jgi:NADH:ubiquinone reductase (H+-translocating)
MTQSLQNIQQPVAEAPSLRAGDNLAVPSSPEEGRKRIVIVGAGFARIAAARALKRCDADVILVDRRVHHIFQPLLYQEA